MKAIVFVCSLLCVFSCQSEIRKPAAPKDEVPKEKMVSLTKDLLLLESHIELSYGQVSKFYKILNSSSDQVFKKHHILREQYIRTFDYYAGDQEKMELLYQEVLDSLNIDRNILQ